MAGDMELAQILVVGLQFISTQRTAMNFKIRFFKGAMVAGMGHITLQAMLLLRNVLIARLLPPEQFGVAVTFVTILSGLDAIGELGIELFLIRSSESEKTDLQSTLHTVMIGKAILSSIVLFLLATPIAALFETTDAIWAYRALAVIPLLKGFAHLDYRRFERDLQFLPSTLVNLGSILIGTLVAIFLAFRTGSFSAMLYGNIVQTAVIVLGSHLVSRRPYQLSFNSTYFRQLRSFGTPLVLNGAVIFLASQGDRVIVGSKLGVLELATYGIATILTGGVTLLFAKVMGGIFLPALSSVVHSTQDFARRYEVCDTLTTCAALMTLIFFALLGAPFAELLYGSNYTYSPTLFTALGTLAGFKIMRNQQQIAFIALGDTKYTLTSNIIAAGGIFASFFISLSSVSIVVMVMLMAAAEACAQVYSIATLNRKFTNARDYKLLLIFSMLAALLLVSQFAGWLPPTIRSLFGWSVLLTLLALILSLTSSQNTMDLVFKFLTRLRN
jgi:O-antigen/teichoic acid export membrane protein